MDETGYAIGTPQTSRVVITQPEASQSNETLRKAKQKQQKSLRIGRNGS